MMECDAVAVAINRVYDRRYERMLGRWKDWNSTPPYPVFLLDNRSSSCHTAGLVLLEAQLSRLLKEDRTRPAIMVV